MDSQCTAESADLLAGHAREIRQLGKRVIGDVIEIGRRLIEAKDICRHGEWLRWLEREFGWSDRQALNFMRVHELSGKFENFSDLNLPISALYLLAAPSTPEKVRNEVMELASHGEKPTVKDIRTMIRPPEGPITITQVMQETSGPEEIRPTLTIQEHTSPEVNPRIMSIADVPFPPPQPPPHQWHAIPSDGLELARKWAEANDCSVTEAIGRMLRIAFDVSKVEIVARQ